MNVYAWVVLGLIAFEALVAIGKVGKPRKPYLASDAVYAVIEWGVIAWLIVMAVTS
ncbi:MAG: hypothetical protein ACHP7F_12405 [Actinomycetales bacterium]|jgi:hypothetical protein